MNTGSYDLDSLRKPVRKLIKENNELKTLLSDNDIPFMAENVFEMANDNSDYDEDQQGRIYEKEITLDLANRFYGMFWGRTDVFARRRRSGNYFPQCENRWGRYLSDKSRKIKIL